MFTYLKKESFVENNILAELQGAFDQEFQGNANAPYENVREITNLSRYGKAINHLYANITRLIENETEYKVEFQKLWLVSSTHKNCDASRLPYIPHFDKARYLKALIYLNDVDENTGPIHLSSQADESIDERRRQLPEDYKTSQLNRITDIAAQNMPVPITGKAGTLILFDTNTPHHAGIVKEGHQRNVMRFDMENSHWNKRTLSSKVKRLFS